MASNNRSAALKRKNVKIADKFRDLCPSHRIKDLEPLVKSLKGDEDAIRAKIQDWWDEPEPAAEPEWEDVNKGGRSKRVSARDQHAANGGHQGGGRTQHGGGYKGEYRGGRSSGGGGRGFRGRGMGRGRGSGSEYRHGGDRSGGGRGHHPKQQGQQQQPQQQQQGQQQQQQQQRDSSPTTTTNSASAQKQDAGPAEKSPVSVSDSGFVTPQDPTPAGLVDAARKNAGGPSAGKVAAKNQEAPAATSGCNVWATKGSAHLIEAEKPKPPPPVAKTVAHQPSSRAPASSTPDKSKKDRGGRPGRNQKHQQSQTKQRQQQQQEEKPEDAVEESKEMSEGPQEPSGNLLQAGSLPASVNGANVNAAGWKPLESSSAQTEIEQLSPTMGPSAPSASTAVPEASPIGKQPSFEEQKSPSSAVSVPDSASNPPSGPVVDAASAKDLTSSEPSKPASNVDVLNMGRWDVSEGDEAQSLDFGFGSFGPGGDEGASVDEASTANNTSISAPEPSASSAPAASAPVPASAPAPVAAIPRPAETTPQAAMVSPARPPPGLSIGGMPPMPANPVLVHELEEKLERASLDAAASNQKPAEETKPSEHAAVTTAPAPPAEPKPVEGALAGAATDKKPTSQAPSQQQYPPATEAASVPIAAQQPGGMSQNYPAGYGVGMYNYGANLGAANAFVGMPGLGATAAGGIPQQQKPSASAPQQPQASVQPIQHQQPPQPPQQQQPPHPTQQQQPPQPPPQQQQGALYGGPASAGTAGTSGTDSGDNPSSSNDQAASNAPGGMPPGIPGAMPYAANPALFYGQQHYQMGQPHGGVGYGYGYGAQFGGAVQGGYGYQQMVGQSGGYGQAYEDPQHLHGASHSSHHSSTSHQGYQKNNHGGGGGYRRNQHHGSHGSSSHQYQNQYNPQQHAGYGGQPYGMGYNVDHFNQRGGYGPHTGNMNPYTLQQSSGYQSGIGPSSGFGGQDDVERQPQHGKGKAKGGNNRGNNGGFGGGANPNMQQFQQQAPHHHQQQQQQQQQQGGQGHQQPFGLQQGGGGGTGGGVTDAATGNSSGWSNQNWGGPSWQGGGN